MIYFSDAKLTTVGDDTYLTLKTHKKFLSQLAQLVLDAQKHPLISAIFDVCGSEERKRRSVTANSYAWVLIDKLAAMLNRKKEDVYLDQIRNLGGNTDIVCVPNKALKRFCDSWGKNGLGWICETTESRLPGCTNVTVYYGSSVFTVDEMSRFIDNIIQDCKAVGIETMSPDKLSELLSTWEEQYAKK